MWVCCWWKLNCRQKATLSYIARMRLAYSERTALIRREHFSVHFLVDSIFL
jgi:hypothetical protein